MKTKRIRTVSVNERGQIVIPEDVRKDLGISGDATLVLIEEDKEIVLKMESDVLRAIEGEDAFWKALSAESMKRAWTEKDVIWDKLHKEANK